MILHPHIRRTIRQGFTLVETLVAITILVVVTVGPLYAVYRSVAQSYAARDKLIATALAQEGVEYVHSIRDNNYLENYTTHDGVNWLNGLSACSSPNFCTVDQGQQSIAACGSGVCNPLRISPANIYTQDTNAAYPITRFTRTVQVVNVSATEVTVTVTVSWKTSMTPYSVSVTEHLYNWL